MNNPMYDASMKTILGTRDEQQDCAFFRIGHKKAFAVVCDGMGGHKCGGLASSMAAGKLLELYEKKEPAEPNAVFFANSVDILDEHVYSIKDDMGKRLGAGTTLVSAAIEDDELSWLSVGDSRLYILRKNEFVQVTRDHNYFLELERMKRTNEISENSYKAESVRGESLISFIGMGGIVLMDVSHSPFKLLPHDTVLLSTDGLYKALTGDEIKHCLQNRCAQEAAMALIFEVETKAYKHQDNTTCVIIKYGGETENETH